MRQRETHTHRECDDKIQNTREEEEKNKSWLNTHFMWKK